MSYLDDLCKEAASLVRRRNLVGSRFIQAKFVADQLRDEAPDLELGKRLAELLVEAEGSQQALEARGQILATAIQKGHADTARETIAQLPCDWPSHVVGEMISHARTQLWEGAWARVLGVCANSLALLPLRQVPAEVPQLLHDAVVLGAARWNTSAEARPGFIPPTARKLATWPASLVTDVVRAYALFAPVDDAADVLRTLASTSERRRQVLRQDTSGFEYAYAEAVACLGERLLAHGQKLNIDDLIRHATLTDPGNRRLEVLALRLARLRRPEDENLAEQLASLEQARVRDMDERTSLRWELLPPGWWQDERWVRRVPGRRGLGAALEIERLRKLASLGPKRSYVGKHMGRRQYVVFEFDRVVLAECCLRGNAIYWLPAGANWRDVLSRTKRSALSHGAQRIVHQTEWFQRVRTLVSTGTDARSRNDY